MEGKVELSKLKNALGKASKLMSMDKNGTISKIAESKRDSINTSLNDSTVSTESMMTARPQRNMTEVPRNVNSNIPRAIVESFSKNPIDTSMIGSIGGSSNSVLDTIGIQEQARTVQHQNTSSTIQEQHTVQTQVQGIDYPMIRTIVEDIVRKYTSSLSKKMLSESKGSVNELTTMTLGKSFKFLDRQGNIYEATLKKIGNINNKK